MENLGTKAVRGATITLAAQGVKFALSLGITMILARLLTPRDYGLFAMAAVFTGLVAIFRDGGLSIATVQRAKITDAQVSTLFWFNLALGIALALVVVAISPLVGWFYREQALVGISLALAIPFVFNGLGAQPQALLQRALRFRTIAAIEIASLMVSATAGIAAAGAGMGYWSLVIALICSSGASSLLSLISCRWRPGAPVMGSGVRPMLRFGGELTAVKFFDSVASTLDSLLLGKLFGAGVVGIYTRAQMLMLLPSSQVVPPLLSVSLPIMSRLGQDPPRLRQVFAELLCLVLLAASFVTVILVAAPDWLVSVVLGGQWAPVPPVLSLMAGSALLVPLTAFCAASITALGDGARLMRWALVRNAIIAAAIAAGCAWGAHGVALSLSIASLVFLLPMLNRTVVGSGLIERTAIWRVTGIGLGICAAGCIVLGAAKTMIVTDSPLANLMIFGLLNGVFHALAAWVWPSARHAVTRFVQVAAGSRGASPLHTNLGNR